MWLEMQMDCNRSFALSEVNNRLAGAEQSKAVLESGLRHRVVRKNHPTECFGHRHHRAHGKSSLLENAVQMN